MSRQAREAIEDEDTTSYVSVVSWWEIAIKHRLGKLHRMIVCQAREERMPLCTSGPKFAAYEVETIW